MEDSRLPLPLGGTLRSHQPVAGRERTIEMLPGGFPRIRVCPEDGPHTMQFVPARATSVPDPTAQINQIPPLVNLALRPLQRTTIDLRHLPDPLQQAVALARQQSALRATETIAAAVRSFLTYDDTTGDLYHNFMMHDHPRGIPGRNSYLEFICAQRRGACQQYARLTQELLRHTGIPAMQGNCLWAQQRILTTNSYSARPSGLEDVVPGWGSVLQRTRWSPTK